jgi:hypothetical protein
MEAFTLPPVPVGPALPVAEQQQQQQGGQQQPLPSASSSAFPGDPRQQQTQVGCSPKKTKQ